MPLVAFQIAKVIVDMKIRELKKQVAKSRRIWLTKSAKEVRQIAKSSIKKSRTTSKAGDPPIGKTGNLKSSIFYKVGYTDAWIGPTRPKGSHANIIEHGSRRQEPRPFMGPALEKAWPQIRRFRKLGGG